jgi:hypothetical protein
MKTGRTIQRGMFEESVDRQMDVIAHLATKNELSKAAEEYLSQGMNPDETVELLSIDGYDSSMSKACVAMILGGMGKTANEVPEWGFEAEDAKGKIHTNFDQDLVITAKSESEALKKAKAIVEDRDLDKVTRVFRLE